VCNNRTFGVAVRVGFVGAGRIGAPMVRRLVDAGHDVRALGRTEEARAAVAELGATAVAELADVTAGADAVVLCVFTDDQVKQICFSDGLLAAMPSGAVLVLHTTGSPRTAETIAAQAPHVRVVDSPVSGGPHDVAAGRIALFVGGDDGAVDRVRPVLSAYGDPILHVGPVGSGQKVKLVNNVMFAAQLGLIAEGVRFAGGLGIKEAALLSALTHGSGSSRALGLVANAGSIGAFIAGVGEFIGKDVAVARATAAELGGELGTLDDVVNAGIQP
jgi:3-hydroxyisobutyrate dehydrogenase-like beta-hydroxyacid dehydrogenase